MKTYKTWEMLKELTENPNKEFEEESNGLYIKADEDGGLSWDDQYSSINLNDTWKEVKKSVDFLTAIEHGKIISVEYAGMKIEPMNLRDLFYQLENNYISSMIALFILEGKWYIED